MSIKDIIKSLIEQINPSDKVNLQAIIEFATVFRCNDASLFSEYYSKYSGEDSPDILDVINIFKKKNNTDDLKSIFKEFINNVWNNAYGFHLTTNIDADNIMKNGMNPLGKQEMTNDTKKVKSLLDDNHIKYFFPVERDDVGVYYFSERLNFRFTYGTAPEWFRVLTNYGLAEGLPLGDILKKLDIEANQQGITTDAKLALVSLVSKYYEKYKDSRRVLIMFPLDKIHNQLTDEECEALWSEFEPKITGFMGHIFSSRNINAFSDTVILPDDCLLVDIDNKKIFDSAEYNNSGHVK